MRYRDEDVKWSTSDPLDRKVVFLQSIEEARSFKHTAAVERLESDEVKSLVEKPARIDSSASGNTSARDVYYRFESSQPLKYSRAVVDFKEDEGIVISWSRYSKPVASSGTKYLNPRNNL